MHRRKVWERYLAVRDRAASGLSQSQWVYYWYIIIGLLSNTFKVQHVQYLKRGSIRKGISEGGTSSSTYLYLWTVDAGVRTVKEHMTSH